jgi:hypothetical protein
MSGLTLLEVPEANWIILAGLALGGAALATYAVRAWIQRPSPAPAGSFD